MTTYRLTTAPPSLNHAFPTNHKGRRFKSPKYKAWAEQSGWEIKEQGIRPVLGDYELVISIGAKSSKADITI